MEMFMQVEKVVVSQKLLVTPVVYVTEDVEEELQFKLKDIVKRHQGVVVDEEEAATHIIYPVNTSLPEGLGSVL